MDINYTVERRSNENWSMKRPHFHGEYEVLFPLSGSGHMFIDNTSYPLRDGLLYVMDAATPHRSLGAQDCDYIRYVMHFPQETLDGLGVFSVSDLVAEKGCCAVLDESDFKLCSMLFAEMLLPSDTLSNSLRRSAAFIRLISLIVDKWTQLPHMPPRFSDDPVIASVIGYIRTHLSESLTLDSLAERFYVSKSALCHRFKTATGFSVMEYVIHCRVQRARTLLSRGTGVREAGESAGFGDNANFIRTFHRLTGVTPGAYAKSMRFAPKEAENTCRSMTFPEDAVEL